MFYNNRDKHDTHNPLLLTHSKNRSLAAAQVSEVDLAEYQFLRRLEVSI